MTAVHPKVVWPSATCRPLHVHCPQTHGIVCFRFNAQSHSRVVADAPWASRIGSLYKRRGLVVPGGSPSGEVASRDGLHPLRHKGLPLLGFGDDVASKTADNVVGEGKAGEEQLAVRLYAMERTLVKQKRAIRQLQHDNEVKACEARVQEELTATKHALAEQEEVNRKLQVSSEQAKAREAAVVKEMDVMLRALVEQQEANRELQRANEQVQRHQERAAELERLVVSLLDQLDDARRAVGTTGPHGAREEGDRDLVAQEGSGKGTGGSAVGTPTPPWWWRHVGTVLAVLTVTMLTISAIIAVMTVVQLWQAPFDIFHKILGTIAFATVAATAGVLALVSEEERKMRLAR